MIKEFIVNSTVTGQDRVEFYTDGIRRFSGKVTDSGKNTLDPPLVVFPGSTMLLQLSSSGTVLTLGGYIIVPGEL